MAHTQSPKQKALEIWLEFYEGMPGSLYSAESANIEAKAQAKKAVRFLKEEHDFKSPISWNIKRKEYWESVEQEIENI